MVILDGVVMVVVWVSELLKLECDVVWVGIVVEVLGFGDY